MPPTPDDLAKLEAAAGVTWAAISQARQLAIETRDILGRLVREKRLVPPDTSFVVFGSLGRLEFTPDSDIDWALLVDGPADDGHSQALIPLRALLEEQGHKKPREGGAFGSLVFSHELVHRIGGDSDTNSNMTRRILLLLEARALVDSDDVWDRVLLVLLTRYLIDDFGYHTSSDQAARVPRFLLNDIVRLWRTMAVDFAAKRRERGGEGWGIRNFKLRMSRKLTLAAGLIACLGCKLRPPRPVGAVPATQTQGDYTATLANHLLSFVNRTPLEVLAWGCREFGASPDAVRKLFGSYNAFLEILSNKESRKRLEDLHPKQAIEDEGFIMTRRIGDDFQAGLSDLFFRSQDRELIEAVQRYGVF
jgi:predicted nucleotidyltransferase